MKDDNLVCLITRNRDLEDIMIQEYPGIIKEDQHIIHTVKNKHYIFTKLNPPTLYKFLKENKLNCDYVILNHKDIKSINKNAYNINEFELQNY